MPIVTILEISKTRSLLQNITFSLEKQSLPSLANNNKLY